MFIEIKESTHTYTVNGNIASISVTELLAKHKIAPSYRGIKKEKLLEKSEEGKKVHKDLENIFNEKGYKPTTKQGENFSKWVRENLDCGVGEQMLAYDYNGLLIAGTADVMALTKTGLRVLGDHKNTSKFHREYVSWQVSLLDYMARQLGKEKVNGKVLNWKGASKFYCFFYNTKTGDLDVKELEKIPDYEIEKLLDCEYRGEIYQRAELVIDKDLELAFEKAEQFLIAKKKELELAEECAKNMRNQLCKIFEEQGIKKWTSHSGLQVTYVDAIEKITTDTAKLKSKYPQIYSECQKVLKQKSHIRIIEPKGDEEW